MTASCDPGCSRASASPACRGPAVALAQVLPRLPRGPPGLQQEPCGTAAPAAASAAGEAGSEFTLGGARRRLRQSYE
ncbi:hypothetical protein NDU88_001204 [Pleurodeles waltl]|uniref:Uncharacterized protein n=1 Tax=Pleurodeles waltl TaxID=8319 RepID=A0AAV7V757_PLEWA|nr:hypothetical protein NDU88_001204 [Pleurodeles waltl]